MLATLPPFMRRHNSDRTTDSICTRCFTTVGTARQETALDEIEKDHSCTPWRLDERRRKAEQESSSGSGESPLH